MIFHELIYEFCHEIFARTLFGKPEFTAFHEIMPNIMDFGLFSWERSYRKSYLKNIVKNIVKKYSEMMEFLCEFLIEPH